MPRIPGDGARGTRTPDLLGAIQFQRVVSGAARPGNPAARSFALLEAASAARSGHRSVPSPFPTGSRYRRTSRDRLGPLLAGSHTDVQCATGSWWCPVAETPATRRARG